MSKLHVNVGDHSHVSTELVVNAGALERYVYMMRTACSGGMYRHTTNLRVSRVSGTPLIHLRVVTRGHSTPFMEVWT